MTKKHFIEAVKELEASGRTLPMRGTGIFVTSEELAEVQILVEKAVRAERGEPCPCCGAPPSKDPQAAWADSLRYCRELAVRHGFAEGSSYAVTPDGQIYVLLVQ
jgi:hypothetical protein